MMGAFENEFKQVLMVYGTMVLWVDSRKESTGLAASWTLDKNWIQAARYAGLDEWVRFVQWVETPMQEIPSYGTPPAPQFKSLQAKEFQSVVDEGGAVHIKALLVGHIITE